MRNLGAIVKFGSLTVALFCNYIPSKSLIYQTNTNSRSTYRQTLGYNKFILRQAPLSGVFSPSRGRCRHYADRGADRQTSLSAVALQGQRSDLTELILSVDFVYRTIENYYKNYALSITNYHCSVLLSF